MSEKVKMMVKRVNYRIETKEITPCPLLPHTENHPARMSSTDGLWVSVGVCIDQGSLQSGAKNKATNRPPNTLLLIFDLHFYWACRKAGAFVAVRQKLYYRALVPQIIWQLRFPYPTYIESRQIEFIGKTRTRTNWNKRERLQRYKSWRRRWHIQHQKRGTKGKGRNKWQRSEQERKCKQKIMSHHNQYDNVLFHPITCGDKKAIRTQQPNNIDKN